MARTTRKTTKISTAGDLAMRKLRKTPVTGDLIALRAALNAAVYARQQVREVLLADGYPSAHGGMGPVAVLEHEVKQLHAAAQALDEAAAPVVVGAERTAPLADALRCLRQSIEEPRRCACGRYLGDGFEECSTCAQ